ncbi:hypothetical protein [Alcanivorax quisquiliarum]|uniref:Roadblock/LC7 domain-containing protein n=1 Tax=Alcanivorax quisquiliarum TaxID=2933565 RepID=A0ABT0E347_9GAMM|nr:hypothetical protein [Alcanivorax quisquiliarum]MCK0536237.1 hypothetical protein [Alcanivorax quisquiliarum]
MASMTDAIIHSHERATVAGHGQVNLLHFHHQSVLMITAQAVGLYRDRAALDDPLGNGALGFELIPAALRPVWEQHCGYVREQMAGFIGLTSGAVLFVRPDGIALYPDATRALHNQARQWLIPFIP